MFISDKKLVYLTGDGSLCEDCLKNHLSEVGQPNNITCGVDTDTDGLPIYGWAAGECSECE